MKKSLIALAALAATASFAQSTATISGTINVGIMDTGAPGATAAVSTLGGGANAINIVTSEDLGGGLKAGFDGQIRFNAATGDNGSSHAQATNTTATPQGALFHGANVYLGGGFGTVRMGKVIEASNCAFDPWGCTGGAALSAGSAGLSALIGAGTQQQSVSYATPTISGFSASYQTSLSPKAGATGGRTNERQVLSLNYANGPLTLQVLSVSGGANTTSATTAATDDKSKAQSIGGSYDLGVAKISLVNAVSKNAAGTKTADITSIGASVPMGAYTILAGYNVAKKGLTSGTTTISSANDTKMSLGVNYALSKRTTLGADVFKAEGIAAVTGTGATGSAGTGFVIRARHTF